MAQATQTAPRARGPVTGTAMATRRRRSFLADLYGTAVGKKYAMAITGLMLVGFVIAHMIGNLKMYLGASHLNDYAEFLRNLLVPILPRTIALWLMRLGLIGAVLLHIHAAYSLTVMNRQARSVKYQSPRDYQVASFASRTMRWTGVIVALSIPLTLAITYQQGSTFSVALVPFDAVGAIDRVTFPAIAGMGDGATSTGVKGLIKGDWGQFGAQLLGAAVIWLFVMGVGISRPAV